MHPKMLEALQQSIYKYKRILELPMYDILELKLNGSTCSLCILLENACESKMYGKCCIYEETKHKYCSQTPFYDISAYLCIIKHLGKYSIFGITEISRKNFYDYVRKEIKFLESLLPINN